MKIRSLLIFTLLLAAPAGLRAVPSMPLASNGRALQSVVVAADASEALRAVAVELALYLGRISGAEFEVKTGDGSTGIVLGTLAEFPNPSLNEPLKIRDTYDGREAFAIRSEKNRLLLIGATELGTTHAAMRLLEHLGCRWFFPSPQWEIVPRQPELRVSFETTERPRILARRISYGYGVFADPGHPSGGSALRDYEDWARHNSMAGSFRVNTGHAWQAVILANKEIFDEHPEYLALVKGVRRRPQFCVSNPAVRQLAVEWALSYLGKNPDREMVSMECSDGHNQCECENCVKLGSVPDRVFGLANQVAREVRLKFPGKLVGCLAYGEHSEPPSFPLEPNVYVQLTRGFNEGRWSHDELLELWPRKCRNLGFYEYFSVWPWDFDKLPGGRAADLTRIKQSIDSYVKAGATSFSAEAGNNWGLHGRGHYIANKLLWNPDADVKALLADFYEKAFGPGAAAMQRYYERIAPDSSPSLSRSLVGEAFRDVEEAARVAQDRPDVQARLDQLKHYLRYVHLRWQLDHEKDKARQKELSVAVLALAYRTRYEYMNHWAAIRQSFAEDAAKKFDEPGWVRADKSSKPWAVEQPVTEKETEEWFREGLAYFKTTPVKELAFSNDLVPAGFTSEKPVASLQSFQRVMNYALLSRTGEPVEVELTTGVIAAFRNRAPAKWSLRDGDGHVVASGTLPQDGEAHQLAMKVPRGGVYFFEADDAGAGWNLRVEAGRPVTWLYPRGKRVVHLGQMQEMFFYVPKGTRELQYFWNGGPHKLVGDDRKVIAEVTLDEEIVSIPVPKGKDGRVWSISPHSHGQLWFFNAPNGLAASPSALLLPRELVERDKPR